MRNPGSIIVELIVEKHNMFVRKEKDSYDLVLKKEISLQEALTGVDFVIDHLDGRKLRLKSP